MSLGARTTKGGAKTGAKETKGQEKGKTEKPQPKEKVKPQATTEQLRMANMIDRKNDDASDVRRMVLELMEMTRRTEEEVCSALHDCDNDMVAACNLLLEQTQGEWQTNEKKKKKPPTPAAPAAAEGGGAPRERSRARRRGDEGAPPQRGRGAARGGRGARGRPARRAAPPRRSAPGGNWQPDTANGQGNNINDSFPATEDWDNEEWSGSLSDTKVFTPTAAQQAAADAAAAAAAAESQPATEDWDTPETNGPTAEHIPSYTYHNVAATHMKIMDPLSAGAPLADPPAPQPAPQPAPLPAPMPTPMQPISISGTLTAAQSQYLSQLTHHTNYNSVYSGGNYGVYGEAARKPQRARVPPPSKIPMSAVEMPGGGGEGLLDVQFGAEPEHTLDTQQVTSPAAEPQPVTSSHDTSSDANNSYPNSNSMQLNESLSAPEAAAPAPAPEPVVTSATSLEKQLTATMKQLSVSSAETAPSGGQPQYAQHHHRPKPTTAPAAAPTATAAATAHSVYAQSLHHPPVYQQQQQQQQVNSTVASLTGAMSGMYPSTAPLQYQPAINSYQGSSSASVYGGSALQAAYSAYQHHHAPPQPAKPAKPATEHQYDSSVASSNSLTATTTQTTTAKVTTTVTAGGAAGANAAGAAGAGAANASYTTPAALYGAQATYAAYDEAQMMRTTMSHHMGGYYEVGYGVSGGREGTFGLGAGDRFSRTDAASPQQVPAAALPPGYAYFYQPPPPTTYQYGVYPYGGGSSVGGVAGAAGKLGSYPQQPAPQQPPYEQDSYKQANAYAGGAAKAAAGAGELSNVYAKTHAALSKVNSYEKATFHSGTPPPFGAGSHLYIPHHHHSAVPMHHATHQMDVRVNSSHSRRESGGNARAAAKPPATKPAYSQSYWTPN